MRWIGGGTVLLVLVFLCFVAMFPWGMLKPSIERQLSAKIGRPVTIDSIDRLTAFSFTPTIVIRGVHIPQPRWAGSGDLARITTARVRFGAFGALFDHLSPRSIDINGVRLALVRDADRRENWRLGGSGGSPGAPSLEHLRVQDARISYRDAVQDRRFDVTLAADSHGVQLRGTGAIMGHPVEVAAHGPAISSRGAWPFAADITGNAVGMAIRGTMDRPFDTDHMLVDLTTHASDLKLVDALIEAGLFGTQPVHFAAHARHDDKTWTITGLHGTIGRSDLAGHVVVKKGDDRTRVDGVLTSNDLDFDDLASDAGHAKAAALRQRIGRRLVPDTRINLAHVGDTDATIRLEVKHLVSATPSALASLSATLTLDHRKVVIAPLRIGLTRGAITGRIVVDQHDGGPVPKLTLALDLANSSITTLAGGGGEVSGSLDGRMRLIGHGSTLRQAVGDGDGRIGLVARDGALPARIASALGFDVARALTADADARAGLRCAVIALDVHGGHGTLDPMVIDTTRAQSHGVGTITFPGEALAIRLTGAPKAKSVLRLPAAIIVGGTVKEPDVDLQKGSKSVGNILKAIGRSITGDQAPRAADADCDALAKQALRG